MAVFVNDELIFCESASDVSGEVLLCLTQKSDVPDRR